MTVRELIAKLNKIDPDRIVVMSSDSEGNNYSPLSGMWTGAYRAENTYRGEVGLESLTEDTIEAGYTDDDVVDGKPALILTPIC